MYPIHNNFEQIHETGEWSCPCCTLLNPKNVFICGACGSNTPNLGMRIININNNQNNLSLSTFTTMLKNISKTTSSMLSHNINKLHRDIFSSHGNKEFFENKWKCIKCAFINMGSRIYCEICNYDRGVFNFASGEYNICLNCNYHEIYNFGKKNCSFCFSKLSNVNETNNYDFNMETSTLLEYESITLEQSRQFNDIYKNIYEDCVKNNVSFIDDSFPHSKKSIGEHITSDRGRRQIPNEILWLRPAQIFTKDGCRYRWAVFRDNNLLTTDIEQGLLGNCWFLSSLAVCTEKFEILKKIFITSNYQHNGIYCLSLCIDGMWKSIIVDDFFPCFPDTKYQIFAVGRRNQLWVPLIEKAFAKAYGNYANLSAGTSAEGFSALTGCPTQQIDLRNEMYRECSDILWVKIISSKEAGFLMGCSAGNQFLSDKEYLKVGLQKQHGYSFLDTATLSNGTKIVKLRNPWGKFVWNKEYSNNWSGWNIDEKKRLMPNGIEAGVFWMPFDSFCKYFTMIEICKIRTNWKEIRIPLKACHDWSNLFKLKTIKIIVTEDTEATFVLHQTNSRSKNSLHDLLIVIYEENTLYGGPGNIIAYSEHSLLPFVVTEDVFLKSGIYFVNYFSFYNYGNEFEISKNDESKKCDLIVSIHSSKILHASVIPASFLFYQRSLANFIKTYGVMESPSNTNVIFYKMQKTSCGIITYVENIDKNKYAFIKCKVNKHTNLLRTRQYASTHDIIPPCSGMIIHVFTQMEPSQSYGLEYTLKCSLQYFQKGIIEKDQYSNTVNNHNNPDLNQCYLRALHSPFPIL
ncbi:Calpain-15 [Strongyloides ratti]|uniref:Calpain-15 n=1 Tax=Strongyloides ratti TaxID=34506 RepID=A0A090MW73_STRRB|nr:Calpain-15 [Strongyloides ratti]CEF63498.1 Calpain-15 [Strongyloides ratti]